MSDNEPPVPVEKPQRPSLLRNFISYLGMAISAAALTSFLLLFLISITKADDNPYTDLIIFIMIPSVLVFGLFVVIVGALWERRRRIKNPNAGISKYPVLDLNDAGRRRSLIVLTSLVIVFMFMSAFGSYRAYEYTESVVFCGQACHNVMKPEAVAYKASPHAKIKCVECHVGEGAGAYVNSKFTGMRQLWGVITGHYNRPIETPVRNLRSATETCQNCHWAEKYHGDVLKVFNHYDTDEKNSLSQVRMAIKVGGGNSATGPNGGIHWHMNLANKIDFISDARRVAIPWVRFTDGNGKSVEYKAKDVVLSAQDVQAAPVRRMDCTDCHNRPAHVYLSPNTAVDRSLDAGLLNPAMPFIKAKAVETLSKPYSTNDEAVAAIASDLNGYYRTSHPDLVSKDPTGLADAVAEVQRIYQTYFFPEMKTDWQAHPNHIGHLTAQGCFRCHDGQHVSDDGRVIRNECNICHTTISQTIANNPVTVVEGNFQHPVVLGDRDQYKCAACHKGDRPFKHPLNLGDISRFQCADCHSGTYDKVKY